MPVSIHTVSLQQRAGGLQPPIHRQSSPIISPKICPFPRGDLDPGPQSVDVVVPLAHTTHHPKRHPDQICRFSPKSRSLPTDRQTHRRTDGQTGSTRHEAIVAWIAIEIISTLLRRIGIPPPRVAPGDRVSLYKDRQSYRRVGVF